MRYFNRVMCYLMAVVLCVGLLPLIATPTDAASPVISYQVHCQDIGWMSTVKNGGTAGTTGQCRQMEAIKVSLSGVSGGVTYRAHVANIGWQSWVSNNATAGTTGKCLQMEAVQINLTGSAAQKYDICYRVHMKDIGWGSWVSNGATAGTTGQNRRIEAIEIQLNAKGSSNYTQKMNSFINNSNWKNGVSWGYNQTAKTKGLNGGTGCAAYCADFVYQVYGVKYVSSGQKYYNVNEIRAGDVIKVRGGSHWVVVLGRSGNRLYTAEGNWSSSVVISNSAYTINSAGKLCRDGKVFRTWDYGYHYN